MKNVAIVDYGIGNLDSVMRAAEVAGAGAFLARAPEDLEEADGIILPGVGAFAAAMSNLESLGFREALSRNVLEQGKPFLGICLGMQLLATTGREGGTNAGLGWIEGDVRRLEPTEEGEAVPHVGWNSVDPVRESTLFRGVEPGSDFYFVHSYHFSCANGAAEQSARTDYCGGFTSAVERDNIFGVQFHPEKSQRTGLQVLRNFLAF